LLPFGQLIQNRAHQVRLFTGQRVLLGVLLRLLIWCSASFQVACSFLTISSALSST
jgi:hypothetical protein